MPDIEREDIFKEVIVAFLVTKKPFVENGKRRYAVNCYPITFDWEGATADDTGIELGEKEEVIGIIPAPPGSYAVKGFPLGSDLAIELGYEFAGAYKPDWKEELIGRSTD